MEHFSAISRNEIKSYAATRTDLEIIMLTEVGEREKDKLPYHLYARRKTWHKLTYPLVAQTVKRLPTLREIRVWSLGREDPLEKEMATHSSNPAWKIPGTEEPGRL